MYQDYSPSALIGRWAGITRIAPSIGARRPDICIEANMDVSGVHRKTNLYMFDLSEEDANSIKIGTPIYVVASLWLSPPSQNYQNAYVSQLCTLRNDLCTIDRVLIPPPAPERKAMSDQPPIKQQRQLNLLRQVLFTLVEKLPNSGEKTLQLLQLQHADEIAASTGIDVTQRPKWDYYYGRELVSLNYRARGSSQTKGVCDKVPVEFARALERAFGPWHMELDWNHAPIIRGLGYADPCWMPAAKAINAVLSTQSPITLYIA